MKSRIVYAGKNVFWGYISTFLTTIFSFITRTVFINTIGVEFLGINGLFTSILGVLTLTELGIGAAMNYSLYKPVAENDYEKIKSLMLVYKRAYQIIALVVTVLGLAIFPFLDVFIKGAEGITNIKLYYFVFLFNTVSTYFVSYKYSLVNADQKHYVITNLTSVFNVLSQIIQLISLIIFKNYVVYLLVHAVFLLAQKIYISLYINKHYPYLKEKSVQPIANEDKNRIIKDVKALILHKIGDISVNQTDNIIISSFINITTVGLVSNYTLITNTVSSFVNIAFNGIIGSLGNLIATSDNKKQYEVFKSLDFLNFWIFSFSSVALFSLVQPFILLMWGKENLLPILPIALFLINYYMVGQRISVNNFKVAAGIFTKDKYLPLAQSIVNLVVSIIFAKQLGLVGVYIGTIASGLIASIIRPYIVFKYQLKTSSIRYFSNYIIQFLLTVLMAVMCMGINNLVMRNLNVLTFAISVVITAILPNLILFIIYGRTNEFKYLKTVVSKFLKKNSK